jgi:hypothetical protein
MEMTVKDLIEALKQSPEECKVKCCSREFCNPAEARIVAIETSHSANNPVLIVFKDLKRMV